jgi:hypothetical protein
MRKIIILDYHSRETFIISDSPDFYDEKEFDVESMLDYLSEEHEIDLRTDDIHWMITDNAIINVL